MANASTVASSALADDVVAGADELAAAVLEATLVLALAPAAVLLAEEEVKTVEITVVTDSLPEAVTVTVVATVPPLEQAENNATEATEVSKRARRIYPPRAGRKSIEAVRS